MYKHYKSFLYPECRFTLTHNKYIKQWVFAVKGSHPKICEDLSPCFRYTPRFVTSQSGADFIWNVLFDNLDFESVLRKKGFFQYEPNLEPLYHLKHNVDSIDCYVRKSAYPPGVEIYTDSESLSAHLAQILSRFDPQIEETRLYFPDAFPQDIKNFLLQANFSLLGEDFMICSIR